MSAEASRRCRPRGLIRVLLVCASLSVSVAAQDAGRIFVVRHAEKQSNDDEAELSGAGLARSECLAQTLSDARIRSVLVTRYVRTRQTAAFVVRGSKAQEQSFEPKDYKGITAAAKSAAKMGNVLIVGHSNTIPTLMENFGTPAVSIPDAAYDLLFVFNAENPGDLLTLHYCPNLPKDTNSPGMKP